PSRQGWEVRWWAGPWPVGLEPAGPESGHEAISARAQVLLDDSRALLLCYRSGGWVVEGVYD
ncbi:MAG TPA: hypothetical protein DIW80_01620, partial [Gordonia polyisoprenivorans]|nr:hypothetical protein [Gordonia polyisoprenivorans]